ncbi:MAG: YeeE/YedE thiosulfate transporter family protein [Bacteroidota bacterium]
MWEAIIQPWPWYVAGPLIALVMLLLVYFGESFGVSGNLRTICSAAGAGKHAEFFRFNWKAQRWNLVFVLGAIIGGFLAANFMTASEAIQLAEPTVDKLEALGFTDPGKAYLPAEIFGVEQLMSVKGLALLLIGGFLVGFGTRWAGGCTSGHAISGLSNLQIPSLIAVIGFFLGGLTMIHLLFPLIF